MVDTVKYPRAPNLTINVTERDTELAIRRDRTLNPIERLVAVLTDHSNPRVECDLV